MSELVNLLLDALLPGATASPAVASCGGGSPGVAGKTDGSSEGSFLELILGNMEASKSSESRAGQQVTEKGRSGESDSEKTAKESAAGDQNLLGSSLETPDPTIVVDAALILEAAPLPAPGRVEDQAQPKVSAESVVPTPAPAEPNARGEIIGTAPSAAQPNAVDATDAAVEAPPIPAEVSAEKVEVVADTAAQAPAKTVVASEVPPQIAPLQEGIEVAKPGKPASEVVKPPEPRHDDAPLTAETRAAREPSSSPRKEAYLPEMDAPLSEASTAVYSAEVRPLKAQSAAADASRNAEKQIPTRIESDASQPVVASAIPNAKPDPAQSASSIRQLVEQVTATTDEIPAAAKSGESELNATKHERGDFGSASDSGGLRPSFERSVAGAENSNGYHAPERVVEQKVIQQIVRAAKIHLVDGGASMTLRLEPPHLGTVQMSVSAQQGVVTANLQASTQTAKHVLEADLSLLKQSLADAGIVVDSINVSVGAGGEYDQMLHGEAHGGRTNQNSQGNAGSGRSSEFGVRSEELGQGGERLVSAFDYLA